MAQQFKEQGGAATMDPSSLRRWLQSKVMTHIVGPKRFQSKRERFEKQRAKSGASHRVEYFHQVRDGYSHLAAQCLAILVQRYDIELVCHLVDGPSGNNAPEPDLLLKLSRYDASCIASEYGLTFSEHPEPPSEELANLAIAILAAQSDQDFIKHAAQIGDALWSADQARLHQLAQQLSKASPQQLAQRIEQGNTRRAQLGHYSGAMFYYGGEWYWGVDRLYHLEKRLGDLGVDRTCEKPLLMPRPAIDNGPLRDDGSLTLEFYPSLRSPYTAIVFDRVLELASATGLNLEVRPVLPMVMRGVPATQIKGMYIFADAAREAREAAVDYGNFYDPIGDPVRRCYSLYPWACEQGKGIELLSAFLNCAFAKGINTNTDRGLQQVVEQAGLDWQQAKNLVGQAGWEEPLENNRLAMYKAGLWGVPSFRLLGTEGQQLLALWGQDRLWLIAREIQRQLKNGD